MTGRDLEYIEARLLAPASDLLDVIERLRKVDEGGAASRLMTGLIRLTDLCREERRMLVEAALRDRGITR
jgi:hypothetical protein